jgi:uncharacterized repeat protein (TIGR03987 family)
MIPNHAITCNSFKHINYACTNFLFSRRLVRKNRAKPKHWHVIAFWIGFTFDVSGTYAMHLLAKGPFDISEPHTLTGQIALWLMLIHAIWATQVVIKNNEKLRTSFHKFSIVVWLIWLIPYFGGMYLGMNQ